VATIKLSKADSMVISQSKRDTPKTQIPTEDSREFPLVRIRPARRWVSPKLHELWEYRELLYFLIWRDVKVRYKQTAIGALWAVFQPLITMIIFMVVFRMFANVPSDGLPYSIFSYTALLPWNLFAGALTRCSSSIVAQSHLISKVYFPRLIVPLSATISGLVDFAVAFVILLGMMVWFGIFPSWAVVCLPFFLLLALITALAVGLWLSALEVQYRDVGHAIPLLIQLWMFASPIAYPLSLVPHKWRLLYSLNPMAGVIEGFRWTLLGKDQPDFVLIAISAAVVVTLLFGGILYFKRMEQTFADVV
jgi:lipopolysaccharide transport system permease protein